MRLLKIGTLNIPNTRWIDALDVFDEIDVFCLDTENQVINSKIHYYTIDSKVFFNRVLIRLIQKFSSDGRTSWLCDFNLMIFRLVNGSIFNKLKNNDYDFIHSSYNDFDESAMLTCALKPKKYTRAQKETRPSYSYLEKKAFDNASMVVLNDKLNLAFYRRKYGAKFLEGKNVLYGLDEDVRSKTLASNLEYAEKLSDRDATVHAVILAGKVLSNPNDSRSGGRLYYIPLIEKLLNNNVVVHLYTGKIVEFDGKNPYLNLSNKNHNFIIEGSLDFINNTIEAYKRLSQYDIGICHAHLPNSEVTKFDLVNIPHRYYEYHLAHVVPFDIKGGNLLLEKKAEQQLAYICNSYNEINIDEIKKNKWENNYFSDYIRILYEKSKG